LKKNKLIIFDIDGTLADSVEQHQKAFTESLLEIGVNTINTEFNLFKHHTDSFIAKEIYELDQQHPFSVEKFNQFEKALTKKITTQQFEEISGAKELIEKLKDAPNTLYSFATGSLRKAAEHKLNSVGINFESWQLVASDHIYEREKILEKVIKNSCERYKIKKFESIISVGDGIWDLITANNLDIEFVGVGLKNKQILLEKGAKIVYKDLSEFE
jgi:phosphoglycolate phosphatase-like HAD superfamily hydrolase